MAINYSKYIPELKAAIGSNRTTMLELEGPLTKTGFALTLQERVGDPLDRIYLNGTLFFARLWQELKKALDALDQIDDKLAMNQCRESQIFYDEISLRQRKLFEALTVTIMFARPSLYANNHHRFYFWNYHLNQDREYLRKRNVDLQDFFGGACAETMASIAKLNTKLAGIAQVIDENNCTWNRDERAKFINASTSATILEQVALGFGYQAVFGSASSQIHLNMSGLFEPGVNERSFLMRAENLLLLAVCIVMRAAEVHESTGGRAGQAVLELRSEYSNAFPNSYAMSVLGASDIGDIVHVFDTPDIFAALVVNKRTNGRYSAYEVEPLLKPDPPQMTVSPTGMVNMTFFHPLGHRGWYGDFATKLSLRRADQESIVKQAIADGFTTETEPIKVLAHIFRTQDGIEKYVREPMNRAHLPEFFFVERMIAREKLQ